jgi:hypothetical protein
MTLKITSLNTDASAKAIGAVLFQKDKDGRINPFKDPPAINPPPPHPPHPRKQTFPNTPIQNTTSTQENQADVQ